MTNSETVVDRFNKYIDLADFAVLRLEIDIPQHQCMIILTEALLLKREREPRQYDPEQIFSPACLRFVSVRRVSFPGDYYFNETVIDYNAMAVDDDTVEFSLKMTGGTSETFIRSLVIEAGDFSLEDAPS
jgi:hypothetical protein